MTTIWTKEEEVQRLQRRFNELKSLHKISQARFARENEMPGGASMITQHLKSTRPISMEHALVYARGFKCQLSEISPRLAKLVADGQATVNGQFVPSPQQQFAERRAFPRVVSLESAIESIANHLSSIDGYNVQTVISLMSTLANQPNMHRVVADGLKLLKPDVPGDPSKHQSPAQKTHSSRAA